MKRGKGIYRARAPRARTAKPLMPRVAAPAVGEVGGAEALPLPLVGLATPDEAVVALVVVGAAELGAWVDEGTADEAGGAADEAGGAAEDAGGAADDAGGAADEVGGGAADEAPAPASTAAQRVCREVMTSPIGERWNVSFMVPDLAWALELWITKAYQSSPGTSSGRRWRQGPRRSCHGSCTCRTGRWRRSRQRWRRC